ncbi:hypothetical protein [Paenibacillus aceti]|uniref:Uncharacterized protein n=1 Tax=Paenibacillus aceti TaxID=1820010 RepID=A0ABQ1W9J0_9BACL|nr:hypothetical protein [Paenibacillus aceti]GGG19651.1 hypothetical protein GCM10010913_47190 [Paenibacillus aceti]
MKNLTKKELIRLLDKGNPIDEKVFEQVDGEAFASSNDELNIAQIRETYNLLVPKTTWTKVDYVIKFKQLLLEGTTQDSNGDGQLLLNLDGITDKNYTTTSDAISQLFQDINMSPYAKHLLKDTDTHYNLIQHNYNYWFGENGLLSENNVLVRTVIEHNQPIIRCFATPRYQQIDNHILLYCTIWALDKLKFNFTLTSQKLDHSNMELNFLSNEYFELDGVGKLSYGFKVRNSESKIHTVEIHPTCNVTNKDGSSVPLILDKTIKIKHMGSEITPAIQKILELEYLPEHIKNVKSTILAIKTKKIDQFLAYKIQQELIRIIGKTAFKKYQDKYFEVSSNNTYSLLQFFGKLGDLPVENDEKKLMVESMFWSVIKSLNE